jgi:hypothetical protein
VAVDQATYQRWWLLHLRTARGEGLDAEEQTFHDTVRRQLEQEETLEGPSLGLHEARAAVVSLEKEHSALEARRRQIEAEIAALETALGKQSPQPSQG